MNLRNRERLHALLPSATMAMLAIVVTICAAALLSAQIEPYSEANQAPLASATPCASGDLAHSVAATSPGSLSVRDIEGSESPAANLDTAASAPGLDGALIAPSADDQSGLTLEQVKQAVNTRGARWQAGETSVSGLSFDQKIKLCGLLSSPEADAAPLLTAPRGFVPYGTFDWRNKDGFDWMTPVKDQGPCGTCWVYGTIASLEAVINIEQNNPDIDPDLSEQQVLSCKSNPTCCAGDPTEAYSFLVSNGVADEGCFPYNCPDTYNPVTQSCACGGTVCSPCPDWATRAWRISEWKQVAMTPDGLKYALQEYGPLGIAMKAPDDFMFYESGIYEPVLESGRWSSMFPLGQANHWVTLVGYNDDEGYWIVKNSWGADWGEAGYGRIAYGVLEHYYAYALWGATGPIAPPVTTPTPIPTPTPRPVPSPTPTPSVVFSDSFEGCLTNWVQDPQNDWYCVTSPVSDGTRSAKVAGAATDATLTLKSAINLSTMPQATLTFSWYIERTVDSGEYVALDLWNGTGWEEAACLRGNIDDENVWHNESIDLSGHLISDFKLCFRATVSSSKERGYVDLVQIAGMLPPQPTPTPTPSPAPTPTPTPIPTPMPTPTPTPVAAYWAVIVGVADYPGKSNDLKYSDDDARDMRDALLAGTNWDSGHMRVLIDTQATRANIQSAINWMISSGGAGDAFFFFFSGHGTTVADIYPLDETDGLDEALCQYDFQTTSPIRDDELGDWLAALPGSPVMVAIDTCFSGGMVKADGLIGRGLAGAGIPQRGDGFVADLDDSVNGVMLTACDEDEGSWEFRSLQNGLFTYYFVAGLYNQADSGGNGDKVVSMEEAFDYLYPLVVGYPVSPKQYPQQYDSWVGEAPLVILIQPTPTPTPSPTPTSTPYNRR